MPETLENRMVVESQWPEEMQAVIEKFNVDGYREIITGIFVLEEDAYNYALERISQDENLKREFKKMVVEWFYSGNWIKEG